jgi:hypothetical protein
MPPSQGGDQGGSGQAGIFCPERAKAAQSLGSLGGRPYSQIRRILDPAQEKEFQAIDPCRHWSDGEREYL